MPRLQAALRVHPNVNGSRGLVVTQKGISPLHSLLHARQEMFDNIYWHHTSRSLQMMLLRAVHDALESDALKVERLMGLDDASLLALLTQPDMPASARALTEGLQLRRPYKGVLEISRLAGRLYNRLDALFWDARRRKLVEVTLAHALSESLGLDIADHELLIDIPRPEKWEMDVWVMFEHPPVGMGQLVPWVEATGLQPDDLARYEQHQRRIRVLVAPHLREQLLASRDEVLQKIEELV
jgi:HD superfamily phosphohydrolase